MTYTIEVSHAGLHKHRIIRDKDSAIAHTKADHQISLWNEQWARRQQQETVARARKQAMSNKEERTQQSADLRRDARNSIEAARTLLLATLDKDDRLDWTTLYDKTQFTRSTPHRFSAGKAPSAPDRAHQSYQPHMKWIDRFIPGRRRKREQEAAQAYDYAFKHYLEQTKKYQALEADNQALYNEQIDAWNLEKNAHEIKVRSYNDLIDNEKEQYHAKIPSAIVSYCELILARSEYPDFIQQDFAVSFDPSESLVLVDYILPLPSDIPSISDVKYIASRDEIEEKKLKPKEIAFLYENIIYQLCIRTIHEICEADAADAVRHVVFNGWTVFTDPSTGHEVRSCIISVNAEKSQFLCFNLAKVDPKACFRSLKGIGSSNLSELIPVPPVLQLNKEDKRFTASRDVLETLDKSTNLAAIGWEEFEHLIRQLFHLEFEKKGGEVKITQASRDGGVDAKVFDPDPIRGGTIIIQAKRYANVVGLSAVRDLYGTVVNERANKGILVTTSYFGNDSKAFANEVGITLIDGANLLHLMHQHGFAARIDLEEARTLVD